METITTHNRSILVINSRIFMGLLGIVGRLRTRLKCQSTTVWESIRKPSSKLKIDFQVDLEYGVGLQTKFHIGSQF